MNKKKQPTIETERLKLRPWTLNDAPEVQRLAGDKDIASTTENIPHPYEDGMAEQWIQTHQEKFERRELVNFAITHRQDRYIIGAIGLVLYVEHKRAEIGYWVGKPYWNNGYCTESAHAILKYGFDVLGLNRILGRHLTRNPASGKVMQKIGMNYEGCMRQHIIKWDKFEDIDCYGILKSEYSRKRK